MNFRALLFVLLVLSFLSLLLFSLLFFIKKREGLDECPPLESATSGGLINSANINSIKNGITNLDHLKSIIDSNTHSILELNNKFQEALDINQLVKNLSKSTKVLQKSVSDLGDKMQSKAFAVIGTSKEDLPNPLPQFTDNSSNK